MKKGPTSLQRKRYASIGRRDTSAYLNRYTSIRKRYTSICHNSYSSINKGNTSLFTKLLRFDQSFVTSLWGEKYPSVMLLIHLLVKRIRCGECLCTSSVGKEIRFHNEGDTSVQGNKYSQLSKGDTTVFRQRYSKVRKSATSCYSKRYPFVRKDIRLYSERSTLGSEAAIPLYCISFTL